MIFSLFYFEHMLLCANMHYITFHFTLYNVLWVSALEKNNNYCKNSEKAEYNSFHRKCMANILLKQMLNCLAHIAEYVHNVRYAA